MYRGRLIWPFAVDVALLDTAATAAQPGEGVVAGGYDHDFREPVVRDQGPDAPDVFERQEQLIEMLPCQVLSERGNFDKLKMQLSGADRGFWLPLLFHYVDLEARGLVDASGAPLIKVGARLLVIRRFTGELVRDFTADQIYATEPQDRSWGLSGLQRNLLQVTFEDREASTLSV